MRRSREPVLWVLFGGGGMMAALFMPILVVVLFVASPLGWVDVLTLADLQALVRHPLARLALFVFLFLCLFIALHKTGFFRAYLSILYKSFSAFLVIDFFFFFFFFFSHFLQN